MGSQNIDYAVSILDSRHLSVDTSLLGLVQGEYTLIVSRDKNYCTGDNVKVSILGHLTETTPPINNVVEQKLPVAVIAPVNSGVSEPSVKSKTMIAPEVEDKTNPEDPVDRLPDISSSSAPATETDEGTNSKWIGIVAMLCVLLVVSNLGRISQLLKK